MSFLKRTAFSVAEYFTPVLTTSQFYKTGQITPEEFVLSGDQLVSKCPSWHWGSGNETTAKDYLPKDKQYLYTKGVVCVTRAANLHDGLVEEDGQDGSDDWVVATNTNSDAPTKGTTTNPEDTAAADDDEPYDLDDMDYGDLGEEEEETTTPANNNNTDTEKTDNTKKQEIRTYDISIIYDKLYRCPRVFLQGYNAAGKPLTEQEVQLDISGDHMNKTVTWEAFPYANLHCMSIHPCQHAHTMKRMLEIMVFEESELIQKEQQRSHAKDSQAADKNNVLSALSNNKNNTSTDDANNKTENKDADERVAMEEAWKRVQERMSVDKSLFLFLKFVATVIPTIDYDNTINFEIF